MLKPLLAGLLCAVALSGCTDGAADGPSVALTDSQVTVNDSSGRTIACNERARLDVDATGGEDGSFTVSVRAGGVPAHQHQYNGSADLDVSEELTGPGGTWVLEVHRSLEHDGRFTVTLTCL